MSQSLLIDLINQPILFFSIQVDEKKDLWF